MGIDPVWSSDSSALFYDPATQGNPLRLTRIGLRYGNLKGQASGDVGMTGSASLPSDQNSGSNFLLASPDWLQGTGFSFSPQFGTWPSGSSPHAAAWSPTPTETAGLADIFAAAATYHAAPVVAFSSGSVSRPALASLPLTSTAYDPTPGSTVVVVASAPVGSPTAFASGKVVGGEVPVAPRADTSSVDGGGYGTSGTIQLIRWDGATYDAPNAIGVDTFNFTGSITALAGGAVTVVHSYIPQSPDEPIITTYASPRSVLADGISATDPPYQYNSQVDFNYFDIVSAGSVTARNGGQVHFNSIMNTSVNPFSIHTSGNNVAGSMIEVTSRSGGGSGMAAGGVDNDLTIVDSTFGGDPGTPGPDTNFSGFTNYTLTNSAVDGGTLNIQGSYMGYWDSTLNTYVPYSSHFHGSVPFLNGARGQWNNLIIGDPAKDPMTIRIDATSSLTLTSIDTYNTNWIVNGTLNLVNTVRDGGSGTSLSNDLGVTGSQNGILNLTAGALLTTVGNGADDWWGGAGHPGITLTGQGTADRMYPVNHGYIQSDTSTSSTLIINAPMFSVGQDPGATTPTDPLITSGDFHNYRDGSIRIIENGGSVILLGFTGTMYNDGLIWAAGQQTWDASQSPSQGFNWFTSTSTETGNGLRTIEAAGASAQLTFKADPAVTTASVTNQWLLATQGGQLNFSGYNTDSTVHYQADTNGTLTLTGGSSYAVDGNNLIGDSTGTVALTGIGTTSYTASLTLTNLNLSTTRPGPALAISGFTTYVLAGTGNGVGNGTMIDLPGITGPTYALEGGLSVNYTTLYGNLTLSNHATGTLHDLLIGNYTPGVPQASQPAATVISVGATSSLTVRNVTTMNTLWVDNGTIYIDGTVSDGGYGATLSGQGIFSINAGATMTTQGTALGDHWNVFGMKDMTLTGQGTADRMYPVNHGTIISDTAGRLTINLYPVDSSDPITNGVFHNYADGVVAVQGTGHLTFNGIALKAAGGGFDNEGLIRYTSTGTNDVLVFNTDYIFSSGSAGTMKADGAGVVWSNNPGTDYNNLVENQHMIALNSARMQAVGMNWNLDTLYTGANSTINFSEIGSAAIVDFNPATMGDPTGSITLAGRGSPATTASLTLPDANLTASALGPTVAVSGFTTYNLAGINGAVVSNGTMIDLGPVTGTAYALEGGQSRNYTTLYGTLTLSNHATGTLHELLIGNYTPGLPQASQPAATVISVDATSSLTVRNVTTMNTLWVDNGTIYIDGTVSDGGYGATLSGHGIFSINAGATMTTQGSELGDHWNVFGMLGMTLTGQGTADHMYPVNHGTILSPPSGALTIKALASGSWEPDATYPLAGTSQTFYNYSDGVVRFAASGGIDFKGFTDGFNNQGLIEVTSTAAWNASPSGLNGHVFSTLVDGTHPLGTMQANGAGVVWQGLPGVDDNATIDYQNIKAINGATINFNGFDVHHGVLSTDAASTFGVGVGVDKAIGADTGTPNLNALTAFSSTTLTGGSTVLKLTSNDAIALDGGSSIPYPALAVTGGATLQLYGDNTSRLLSTGGTAAFATLSVDGGGTIAGAGNTSSHQVRLIVGDGGTLTVFNPNLAHAAGTINLANAPVLPSSAFRFSAARAPGTGTGGTVAADSLPGATSAQTLTLLGDLQMAAASTLNVTIFGDSTNANSLLMAGSTGTSASTLNGTLAVTVASGVASLSATTLFVVFQENGAGYGSTRFGNAPATGSTITSADGNWIFGVTYANNQVILGNATAVPEPSTYAMLAGLAALGLAAWHRRRRTRPGNI